MSGLWAAQMRGVLVALGAAAIWTGAAGCDGAAVGGAEQATPAYLTCEDVESHAPCCTSLEFWERIVDEDGALDCPDGYTLRENEGVWGLQQDCEQTVPGYVLSAGSVDWSPAGGLADYSWVEEAVGPGGTRIIEAKISVHCDLVTGRARWASEYKAVEGPNPRREWCYLACWDEAGCEARRRETLRATEGVIDPPGDCADLR